MKEIDEIFKEGIGNEGLPYDAKQWAEVEKGLNASTGKSLKKRLRISYLISIGLAITLIVVLFSINDSGIDEGSSATHTNALASQTEPQSQIPSTETALQQTPRTETSIPQEPSSAQEASDSSNSVQQSLATSTELPSSNSNSYSENTIIELAPGGPTAEEYDRFADGTIVAISTESHNYEESIPSTALTNNENAELPQKVEKNLPELFSLTPVNRQISFAKSKQENPDKLKQATHQNNSSNAMVLFIQPNLSVGSFTKDYSGAFNLHQKTRELSQFYTDYGLKFGSRIGRFSIYSGLSHLSMRERTSYYEQEDLYDYDTSLVLVKKHFGTTDRGTIVALLEERVDSTFLYSQQIVDCEYCLTKFDYIRIPVGLEYQHNFGRLGIVAGADASINRLLRVNGLYWLDSQVDMNANMGVARNLERDDVKQTIFSFGGHIGLSYKVKANTSVYSTFSYVNQRTSMLEAYDQRATLRGVDVGVKYYLLGQ